jgi:gamma-glutamyltranspeptidase/glutathione hydrolase
MFHTKHFPDSFAPHAVHPGSLYVESRVGSEVLGELRTRGHDVVDSGPWSLGRMCAVGRDGKTGTKTGNKTGMLSAAANPRGGQGYAAGR